MSDELQTEELARRARRLVKTNGRPWNSPTGVGDCLRFEACEIEIRLYRDNVIIVSAVGATYTHWSIVYSSYGCGTQCNSSLQIDPRLVHKTLRTLRQLMILEDLANV